MEDQGIAVQIPTPTRPLTRIMRVDHNPTITIIGPTTGMRKHVMI